jgi:acyl carrier protein
MKNNLIELILRIAEEMNPTLARPIDIAKAAEAGLYGFSGILDSLALVRLIVEVEVAVEDQFGVALVLASERAMSQRRSPFLTVGSLADYIEALLQEAKASQGQ